MKCAAAMRMDASDMRRGEKRRGPDTKRLRSSKTARARAYGIFVSDYLHDHPNKRRTMQGWSNGSLESSIARCED